jgi:hypothetical protein
MRKILIRSWSPLVLAAALLLGTAAGAQAPSAGIAPAPDQVRPLLVGSPVPAAQLRTAEDAPFDLVAALVAQPTVLVFYRGHW